MTLTADNLAWVTHIVCAPLGNVTVSHRHQHPLPSSQLPVTPKEFQMEYI